VGKEEEMWRKAEALIATKKPKDYDQAVQLLTDLRDLGQRQGGEDKVQMRLQKLRERHAAKHSLLKRIEKAGLTAVSARTTSARKD
jgi:uncharacterized Zn finger protein